MLEDFVRTYQGDPLERAGAIHPSSLKGCHRQAVYQYLGLAPDREHTEEELRLFAAGYMIEDFAIRAIESTGKLITSSLPIKAIIDGIRVEGIIDAVLRVDGGWSICDVKSTSSWGLKHYDNYPYDHHVTQIGAYSWAIGQMGDVSPLLPMGKQRDLLLLYIGKDDLHERPCRVSRGHAETQALAELDKVVGYIKIGTIPDRQFATPDEHRWLCAKCIERGYQRKDGTFSPGKEPVYKPSCSYFARCWGAMPEQWSFWEYDVAFSQAAEEIG